MKNIELPCLPRDVLWSIIKPAGLYFKQKDAPYPCRVVFIGINDSDNGGWGYVNVVYKNGEREKMLQFDFDQFGKTVFTSKKEAVEAMQWKEWRKHE